jgi:hypothetical protein
MRSQKIIRLFLFIALVAGCTVEFLPETDESQDLLVVDGMITNNNQVHRIRLSRSTPVGSPLGSKPVKGAVVTIKDENGIVTTLTESPDGTYCTDSTEFTGRPGGKYSLSIEINNTSYATDLIEMKPVPPMSDLYYEKVPLVSSSDTNYLEEGCRIYIDTYDPSGECLYFRWDYEETWEYQIPYNVINKICYVSENSDEVLIKNTSLYSQAKVTKFPVLSISNETDRLKETYSILVNQYSLTEEEYDFWDRVQSVSQNVGNLYDITPMAISGNIRCITNPKETVLGYFSVSAVTQERLFIHEHFYGLPGFFIYCATDTARVTLPETGLNTEYWVIEDYSDEVPPFWVITDYKECADCTTRGTSIMPPYWQHF